LLLDEPFAALDALTRMRMHALIEALWRKHDLSVLLITHDVDEAILLADRALVIDRGRIIASITIDLPRPRELSLPGFLSLRKQLLGAIGVLDPQPVPESPGSPATGHAVGAAPTLLPRSIAIA
jgi:sulfonate transport system ATP-binding protein